MVGSPCNPRDSQESSLALQFESINSSASSLLYGPTLTSVHDYWKKTASIMQTFVNLVMSLLFNILFRLVITFLPINNRLLISWLQSPSAVILEPPKIKSVTVSILFPHLFAIKWWDHMPWSSFFEFWVLSQLFRSSLSPLSKAL